MDRRTIAGLLALSTVALSGVGVAQDPTRVLHRPIPGDLPIDTSGEPVTPPASPDAVREAAGAAAPWRENQPVGDHILRPVDAYNQQPRPLDRDTRSPPGARLRYEEVFTPAVAPFKRLQAYDIVDEMAQLTVRDPSLRPLPVGGDVPTHWAGERRARFVGELLVEVSTVQPTLIPGVAGEQRVVSYTTSTGAPVEFERDSAGNLFVRGTESGVLRLTYVLEAPEDAFQSPAVPRITVATAASEVPASERPLVPSWLRERAALVLRHTSVTPDDRLDEALGRLISYFRSFRDAALPDPNGASGGPQLYSDLAMGGVGACRHRAFGLMPTLHALGIPARYVGNEAHAWIEMFVPRVGWTRVDLGGWDVPLDANAPTERPAFRPDNADPFPQPSNYAAGYSVSPSTGANGRSDGGVTSNGSTTNIGPAQGQQDGGGAQPNASQGLSSQSPGGPGQPGAGGTGTGAGGQRRVSLSGLPGPGSAGGTPGQPGSPGDPASGSSGGSESGDDEPEAAPTTLTVSPIRADVSGSFPVGNNGFVRGSMVLVEGEARDDRDQGVGGLAIEVQLVRDGRVIQTLGTTVSQPNGRWEAHVLLPTALQPAVYNVRATTAGDARHASANGE